MNEHSPVHAWRRAHERTMVPALNPEVPPMEVFPAASPPLPRPPEPPRIIQHPVGLLGHGSFQWGRRVRTETSEQCRSVQCCPQAVQSGRPEVFLSSLQCPGREAEDSHMSFPGGPAGCQCSGEALESSEPIAASFAAHGTMGRPGKDMEDWPGDGYPLRTDSPPTRPT